MESRNKNAALVLYSSLSYGDFSALSSSVGLVGQDLHQLLRDFTASSCREDVSCVFSSFDELFNMHSRIWNYPGCFELSDKRLNLNLPADRFAQRQLDSVLFYLECELERSRKCIDSPSTQRRWANKINQVAFFSELDFVSMIPTTISHVVPQSETRRVLKHLSETRYLGSSHAVFTHELTPYLVDALSHLSCPFTIQNLLSADFEYRAMFFGDSCLIVSLDRRSLKPNHVDIHTLDNLCDYTNVCSLPSKLMSDLHRVRRLVDLTIFAIDFFVVDSKFIPLEINAQFSWAWLPTTALSCLTDVVVDFFRKPHWTYNG